MQKVLFRLPSELADQIKLLAVMDHRRYNEVLADAVKAYIKIRYPGKGGNTNAKG